eukprot:3724062-Prymnesium_polylepis.1
MQRTTPPGYNYEGSRHHEATTAPHLDRPDNCHVRKQRGWGRDHRSTESEMPGAARSCLRLRVSLAATRVFEVWCTTSRDPRFSTS